MLCQQHLHVIRIYTPVMRGVVKLDVNSSIHTVLDESVYCLVSLKDEPNTIECPTVFDSYPSKDEFTVHFDVLVLHQ